jgi:two-component system chemotaxis response regulator CheY
VSESRRTFLIVDDSKVVRTIARRMLADLGFETREAADGQAALETCQQAMPEAVLLDWNMPVMDGLGFLRRLRQLPGGSAPKVVFCTSESTLDRIGEALDAGADEYVMKPFDAAILQTKLEMVGLL